MGEKKHRSHNAERIVAMISERGGTVMLGTGYVSRQLRIIEPEAKAALDELVRAKVLRRHQQTYVTVSPMYPSPPPHPHLQSLAALAAG